MCLLRVLRRMSRVFRIVLYPEDIAEDSYSVKLAQDVAVVRAARERAVPVCVDVTRPGWFRLTATTPGRIALLRSNTVSARWVIRPWRMPGLKRIRAAQLRSSALPRRSRFLNKTNTRLRWRGSAQTVTTPLYAKTHFVHPGLEVDPVRPDIDDAPGAQVVLLPAFIILQPICLEPGNRGG